MIIKAANAEIEKITKKNPSEHLAQLLSIYDSLATTISLEYQEFDDHA